MIRLLNCSVHWGECTKCTYTLHYDSWVGVWTLCTPIMYHFWVLLYYLSRVLVLDNEIKGPAASSLFVSDLRWKCVSGGNKCFHIILFRFKQIKFHSMLLVIWPISIQQWFIILADDKIFLFKHEWIKFFVVMPNFWHFHCFIHFVHFCI